MLLLRKTLHSSLLPIRNPHGALSFLHHLSTLAAQNPPPKPPFMAEYLASSCGFPPEEAIKLSQHLTHIKSPSKPDSVLHFLRQSGLTDADVRTFISQDPTSLCANVEKTLMPKFRALQEMGFTDSEIVRLVSHCPRVLSRCDVQPRIELLRSLSLSNEHILKVLKKEYILTASLAERLMPNIALLRECGISDSRIGKMVVVNRRFIAQSPEYIQALVRRAEELGASRGSGLFWCCLQTVSMIGRPKFDAKLKLLKSLGWSDADITATFRNTPSLVRLSEKNICDKVDFFRAVAGDDLSFVIRNPTLLAFSLKRRLVPRTSVLRILKNEGVLGKHVGVVSLFSMTDKKFVEKYVLPHVEKVPGLRETYFAASAGKVPISSSYSKETKIEKN